MMRDADISSKPIKRVPGVGECRCNAGMEQEAIQKRNWVCAAFNTV